MTDINKINKRSLPPCLEKAKKKGQKKWKLNLKNRRNKNKRKEKKKSTQTDKYYHLCMHRLKAEKRDTI